MVALGLVSACTGDDATTPPAATSSDTGTSSGTTTGGDPPGTSTAGTSAIDTTADTTAQASSDTTSSSAHTLGGMLQGLQGAEVEIVNGAETLTLDADGPFEFTTPLDSGEPYTVEVTVQPAGPDQQCTVQGGAGRVANADIDDVRVRCVTPIRHVVVLGLDGFGGDWLEPIATPTLDALRAQGVWTAQMVNVLPTSSSTNWMSMIDGTTPQQHGVLSNGWQPGDSNPPPTMFAALREHQPDATIGIFHDWGDFDRLVEPGVADHVEDPGAEQETMDAAVAWLQRNEPTLLFIHLDHVDHAGHASTWGSAPYNTAVEDADLLTAQLRTGLEDAGLWPYTALIVSSDHGGVLFSHGNDTAAERAIPFILRTPQTIPGELERDLRIWDIAATVLEMLDVPAPAEWVASPVVEGLFDPSIALPPPVDAAQALAVDQAVQLYDETGTGANAEVSVWRPIAPVGQGLLGDQVVAGHGMPGAAALVLEDQGDALAPPRGFELVWQDTGSGGVNDVSLWNPIPALGYVCMGTVAVVGYTPPQIDQLRCVHHSLVQRGQPAYTWDDAGSGAVWDGSMWTCLAGGARDPAATGLATGSFVSRRHASDPGVNRCYTLRSDRVTVGR